MGMCVKLESITPVRRVCVFARVLNHAIDILPSTGVTFCHTCQFKIVLGFLLVCVRVCVCIYISGYS